MCQMKIYRKVVCIKQNSAYMFTDMPGVLTRSMAKIASKYKVKKDS